MPSSKSQRISSASNKLFAGSGTPRVLVEPKTQPQTPRGLPAISGRTDLRLRPRSVSPLASFRSHAAKLRALCACWQHSCF